MIGFLARAGSSKSPQLLQTAPFSPFKRPNVFFRKGRIAKELYHRTSTRKIRSVSLITVARLAHLRSTLRAHSIEYAL